MRSVCLWVPLTLFLSACSWANDEKPENHAFQKITECERDYSEVNFCDPAHVSAIKHAIRAKRPDFNGHYIFLSVTVAGDSNLRSVGIIDALSGMVYPLPFDHFGGYVDSRGFLDKNLKQRVEYSLESDKICFYGSVYAYRNTFENEPSCYVFNGVEFIDQRYTPSS